MENELTYRIEKSDSKAQWDEFMLANGAHPLQLWGWGDARSTLGWQVDRVFVVEDDERIGAVQLLSKRLMQPFGLCLYVPRGPLVVKNTTKVYQELVRYVRENYRAVALIVEPDSDVEPTGEGWRSNARPALLPETRQFDLKKADGVLLAEMTSAVREQIRTANHAEYRVKKLGNPEDITACYRLYARTARERGETAYKERYFHALHEKLGDFSALLGIYDGEELLGFLWLALSEALAFELYDGTSNRGHEVGALAALRWDSMRRVKQWGIARYDLGGVPEKQAGLKAECGGQPVQYDSYVLPLSPLYRMWEKASRNRARYGK